MTTVRVSTLDNGLRVATDEMDSVESASIGVWIGSGGRAEDQSNNGVAHFLEHMAFKGTKRRSAHDIALEVDAVGGHFNAWTGRETTAYYMRLLKDDLPLAVDILSDILQNPVFDEAEIERERGVILQEIGQMLDTPDDVVFEQFQKTAFPNQPLGRSILGPAEGVQTMRRTTLVDFMQSRYRAENMVVAAAGAVNHDQVLELAEQAFNNLPSSNGNIPIEPGLYHGGDFRENKKSEQVHLALGFPSVSHHDEDRYDVAVLSTVLGGGMSSRLFQEAREKRGLVYAIHAQAGSFTDCGLFTIYAGTGEQEVSKLIPVICDELVRIAQNPNEKDVERARAQFRAGLLMARESSGGRAEQLGQQMLVYGRPWSPEELREKINAVTAESVSAAARKIFTAPPTLSALGPLKHLESLEQIQKRLQI